MYTLSEAWRGVNWTDLMAAPGAFGTDFYDRSILRPKHRAYYRSGRSVIKIGPFYQGRESCRLDTSTPIQELKYAVYGTLPASKCHFGIGTGPKLASVAQLVWTWPIMRVVMSSSPHCSENFLILHITCCYVIIEVWLLVRSPL